MNCPHDGGALHLSEEGESHLICRQCRFCVLCGQSEAELREKGET